MRRRSQKQVETWNRVIVEQTQSKRKRCIPKWLDFARQGFGYLALCIVLLSIGVAAFAAQLQVTGVYLYDSQGQSSQAVGYSVVDSHVFDPYGIRVGEVDAQKQIWNEQDTAVIGYVIDTPPM